MMDESVNHGRADTAKQAWIARIVSSMAYGKSLPVSGLLGSEGRVGSGFVFCISLFFAKNERREDRRL